MSRNEMKIAEGRHYMRLFLLVLSAVATLVLVPSLYLGRLQIEELQELEENIMLRSMPIPGEAPHVRAAQLLALATDKKGVDAVLDFCRYAVMISSMVLLSSLVGVVQYRELKPKPVVKVNRIADSMATRDSRSLPTAWAQSTPPPPSRTATHGQSLAGVA